MALTYLPYAALISVKHFIIYLTFAYLIWHSFTWCSLRQFTWCSLTGVIGGTQFTYMLFTWLLNTLQACIQNINSSIYCGHLLYLPGTHYVVHLASYNSLTQQTLSYPTFLASGNCLSDANILYLPIWFSLPPFTLPGTHIIYLPVLTSLSWHSLYFLVLTYLTYLSLISVSYLTLFTWCSLTFHDANITCRMLASPTYLPVFQLLYPHVALVLYLFGALLPFLVLTYSMLTLL